LATKGEFQMKTRLLTTIAGAALIAGCSLALAQTMEGTPAGSNGAQGSSQREPGGAAREHQSGAMQNKHRSGQPGAMQSPAQARSGAMKNKEHRSTQSGMQSPAQERSGAKNKEHRSTQTGMESQAQEPSGAAKGKGHRSSQSGSMQGQTQGRSGTVEGTEHGSTQSGMQSPAQGRSDAMEDKEHRSGQSGAMQGSSQGRTSVFGSTTLSSDQRTRLQQTVTNGNIHRVDHVNFALSVGTHVPNTVTFYDVPASIVDIVPQYRGCKYIAVRDDFAIIDPGTREIVALVPMHGSAGGRSGRSVGSTTTLSSDVGRSGRSIGSTTLSADQRTRLHTVITGGDIRRIDNADFALSVGARVPNTVTFYDLPETIVDIVPEYRGDEYIVVGDQLVIIDPETLEILAVL
jgi:Protein of unknown function (DUF1236)